MVELPHWGLNNLAAILQKTLKKKKNYVSVFIQSSMHFFPEDPIDKLALVQVLTWGQTGNKPLPETKMTKFYTTTRRQ